MKLQNAPGLLLVVGGTFLLLAVIVWIWQTYGPYRPEVPTEAFWMENTYMPTAPAVSQRPMPSTPRASSTAIPVSPIPPIVEKDPWLWDVIHFDSQSSPIEMYFDLPGGPVLVQPFTSYAYYPEILESGIFDPEKGNAIAWTDYKGRIGLWLHSGPAHTVTNLQVYLERDQQGNTRSYFIVEDVLDEIVGSRVVIRQSALLTFGRIAATVRVGPYGVQDLSKHVMDLMDYLGLDDIPEEALTLYFCGRQLAGEKRNPDLPHWQQARFIIVILPEGEPWELFANLPPG